MSFGHDMCSTPLNTWSMSFHDYFPKEKNVTKYSHLVFSFNEKMNVSKEVQIECFKIYE
jgi:hypothetical protein